MRASASARTSAGIFPFCTSFSKVAPMRALPFSAKAGCASTSTTSMPDCAATCAMPAPIWPAPITPSFLICDSMPDGELLLLDHQCNPLAATDAQRGAAAPRITRLHRVQQGGEDACTRGADGMAERHRAAVDVHLRRVQPEQLVVDERDHRERFVDLPEIDLF